MATAVAPHSKTLRPRRGVLLWTWATLAYFILVILGGVVVRTSGSGAGCGDRWPLCNGDFIPHHPVLHTIVEFTHRSMTGVSVVMFIVMIGWTFLATGKRHPARTAALTSGFFLVTEAVLGAVLVLRHDVVDNISLERDVMQSIHFCNTMLLLAAVALTAHFLSSGTGFVKANAKLFRGAQWTLFAILLAGITGALAALADTLFPSASLHAALAADFSAASPLLIRMRWLHPVVAAIVTCATAYWIVAFHREGRSREARLLGLNLLAQIVIGIADILLLAPTSMQLLHLLSADIFWIMAVTLAAPLLFPQTTLRR